MHTKKYITFLILLFAILSLHAQQDTLIIKKDKKNFGGSIIIKGSDSLYLRPYNPEQGYFQKANHDAGDPRFMLANEDKSFKFGIGGYIKVIPYFDFGGMIDNNDFITSLIKVPSENYGQFKIFANYSRLNLKVVNQLKKHTIVGFIEGDFNGGSNNAFRLRHAYVSFAGFTLGQTWTTLMDLEASPSTIDMEGPNNQVCIRQPMIRYTLYKNNFQFAVAAEMPTMPMLEINTPNIKVFTQPQRVPDFITHFKYKWDKGHVQFGAILRVLNYGDSLSGKKSKYIPAGGVALSGTTNMWKGSKFYFQVNAGTGISKYIQDLSVFNYDITPSNEIGEMTSLNMAGGYIGIRQIWHKRLQSNLVYGITFLDFPNFYNSLEVPMYENFYKYAQYFAINTFWNVYDYASVGIEYIFGERVNSNLEKGIANRINLMLVYNF